MVRKILVPVDGSEHAAKAVELACDIARLHNSELDLLHVMVRIGTTHVPEGLREYGNLEHIQMNEHDLLASVANKIVMEAQRRARENGVDKANTVIKHGDPARVIIEYAEQHDIDMIVIGSRGLGDLKGMLLGSVSHKVAHLAECSCITVK